MSTLPELKAALVTRCLIWPSLSNPFTILSQGDQYHIRRCVCLWNIEPKFFLHVCTLKNLQQQVGFHTAFESFLGLIISPLFLLLPCLPNPVQFNPSSFIILHLSIYTITSQLDHSLTTNVPLLTSVVIPGKTHIRIFKAIIYVREKSCNVSLSCYLIFLTQNSCLHNYIFLNSIV